MTIEQARNLKVGDTIWRVVFDCGFSVESYPIVSINRDPMYRNRFGVDSRLSEDKYNDYSLTKAHAVALAIVRKQNDLADIQHTIFALQEIFKEM